MSNAPSLSPVTLALYLGELQLLLRQWQHFHDMFRRDVAKLPPPARAVSLFVFEQLLAASAATAVPEPATKLWEQIETSLRQWIDRYRTAAQQSKPSIGDFAGDAQRLTRMLHQVLEAAFFQSPKRN